MIVTRSWLEEFIDLDDVSNERLYEIFNSIGLEVDSINKVSIPDGVVVGKIISCEKHPDADKLNVCQIDIGEGTRQIVCGAANVVDAEYVAVATVGTTLSEDFKIKPAKLRGIESLGMVCSSSELGLPETDDGIMLLDSSIGVLDIGRELNNYSKIADTVIELELTANRGDCLSIHGVARDLSAVLKKELKAYEVTRQENLKIAMARRLSISNNASVPVDLLYKLAESDAIEGNILVKLRLGLVGLELESKIKDIIQYVSHATGVVLRAYDAAILYTDIDTDDSLPLSLEDTSNGAVELKRGTDILSTIGINQSDKYQVDDSSKDILFEASYVSPQPVIEAVAKGKIDVDKLYYKTSRGSEPAIDFGFKYLEKICSQLSRCLFTSSYLSVAVEKEQKETLVVVNFEELNSIIGQEVSKSEVSSILSSLGFKMNRNRGTDSFGAIVPPHRHDIINIQDIAEEVLRIVGINNIEAKPLNLVEKVRLTDSAMLYKSKREIRNRAVGRGFFEAVTYAFSDKKKLEKYGFDTVDESKKLLNPIAEEFNAMRSTLLVNLLDSVKRNVSYGIKRIPLFEIGTVFDQERVESEKIAFVWSGYAEIESVSNQGKAKTIDFSLFVERLSAVIGDITLVPCREKNGLVHPYQSADILIDNRVVGYISKLHPAAIESYGISETFIAELDFSSLLPKHIIAKPISNYQGVYKDLSLVVDKTLQFSEIESVIDGIDEPILKRFYPIDIYENEELGEQKSVTVRLYIQSMEETLSEQMIESLIEKILDRLNSQCGAKLR